jgi:hypothetical protein
VKLELAQLLLEAAEADRGTLWEEELLTQVTTLNPDAASKIRTAASRLLG